MPSQKWKFAVFALVTLSSLLWAVFASYDYYQHITTERFESSQHALAETRELVVDIEQALAPLPLAATTLAEELGKTAFTAGDVERELKRILLAHPRVFGAGVAFEPYAFDSDLRLYAPYLIRRHRSIQRLDVADHYDYTETQYRWYADALSEQPHWNELYHGEISQTWLVEYLAPVIRDGRPIGLVFVNHALAALQKRIDLTDLGNDGYSFIVDTTGRLIDYPIDEEVLAGTRLTDLPGFESPAMKNTVDAILSQSPGDAAYISDITNKASWIYFEPVPGTDWSVLTVFKQHSLLPGDAWSQRQVIHLLLSWSLFVLLFVVLYSTVFGKQNLYRYWYSVFVASAIMTSGIAALWYISLHEDHDAGQHITPVVSHSDLDGFKRSYTRESLLNRQDPPLYIPTGIFVQSIEFSSANNVVLTGYVWQHYHDGYHKDLSRGIVMPEAEALEIEEAYRRKEQATELIGWYFRVTLRQNFDYGHYPLDRQSVWIRLWHQDFDRNVVLVPDLAAYDQLNPDWLPGMEKDFVISGWTLWQSFFNYHHNSYNTNFGIENYVGQNRFPELYFNIGLKRDFFDPFVSQLAPMVVVLLMLFAILVTSSRDQDRNTLLGFNTSGVLASSSALFFVVLLSHIDLRSTLAAKEIIYLENFYFVTYLALLVVTVNSVLFSWGIRLPVINGVSLIQYRDNLIPKLLFWPMVTGQLLLLTLNALYPFAR